LQQHATNAPAQANTVDLHGGESRHNRTGDGKIIEPRDCQLPRYVDAAPLTFENGADREHVCAALKGVDGTSKLHNLRDSLRAPIQGIDAVNDPLFANEL
jgi:hypothetical protein